MTILDARSAIDRLDPTVPAIVEEAMSRLESRLVDLGWEVGSNADADTFRGIKEGKRERIVTDLDRAGETLGAVVRKLMGEMRDEIELEMTGRALR